MKVLAALVESIIVAHHGRPMLSYVGIKKIENFFWQKNHFAHMNTSQAILDIVHSRRARYLHGRCDFKGVADTGVSHNLHDN